MSASYKMETGSRYLVRDGEDKETEGIYNGLTVLGSETAIVFETEGRIRFIRIGCIESIDVMESVPAEEEPKDARFRPSVYYG